MRRYTTIQGDMWDKIAYAEMGDEKYSAELIRANAEHSATYIFSAGVSLVIPDIDGTEKAANLPPWR